MRRDKIQPCRLCGVLREVKGGKKPTTGLCRTCFNKTMPRGENYRRKMADATRRAYANPVHRAAMRLKVREVLSRMSDEEREMRRELGRRVGLSGASARAHPAGSPARLAAGRAGAETKRRRKQATPRKPMTFEEQLEAVLQGKATLCAPIRQRDPEMTLGGVSAGWMG